MLGVLAGSMSSFFGLGDTSDSAAARMDADEATLANEAGTLTRLTNEIAALRTQVESLAHRLGAVDTDE